MKGISRSIETGILSPLLQFVSFCCLSLSVISSAQAGSFEDQLKTKMAQGTCRSDYREVESCDFTKICKGSQETEFFAWQACQQECTRNNETYSKWNQFVQKCRATFSDNKSEPAPPKNPIKQGGNNLTGSPEPDFDSMLGQQKNKAKNANQQNQIQRDKINGDNEASLEEQRRIFNRNQQQNAMRREQIRQQQEQERANDEDAAEAIIGGILGAVQNSRTYSAPPPQQTYTPPPQQTYTPGTNCQSQWSAAACSGRVR